MRIALAALVLTLILAPAAIAQRGPATAGDPNQQAFEAGMTAAARGDPHSAIVILEALAQRTDAPRVRLELARLLFQVGEFRRSKAEFLKVYRRDLPYPVRRAVNVYLDQIDRRIGYLQPEFGLVGDSNPTRAARSGDYQILGANFAYRSSADQSLGLRYRLVGVAPITPPVRIQWLVAGVAEGVEFPGPADVHAVSASLRREDHGRDAALAAGWRWRDQQGTESNAPFVQFDRRWTPRRDRQLALAASVELTSYPQRPDLDGASLSLAANYVRDVGTQTSVRVGAAGVWGPRADGLLPHQTLIAQAGASRSLPRLKANLTGDLSLAAADFTGIDPFFGKARSDTTATLTLAAYRASPVWGLFPGVVATLEDRRSSIDFFGYRRASVSFDFRRRF